MRINRLSRSNKGFSLIEIAIGVVLLGILVSSVLVGGGMQTKMKVQHESDTVTTLVTAAHNYLSASQTTFTGVSMATLQAATYVPASFNAVNGNSWGGAYSVAANAADSTKVDISIVGVPDQTTATLLTNNFSTQAACAYNAGNKTWVATF